MKSGWILIFTSFLLLFLAACSSPPATPPAFIHVVPNYQEVVAYDIFPTIPFANGATSKPPITGPRPYAADLKPLSDAGLPCTETYQCEGFCLALEPDTALGYCSDTRSPQGCWEYLLGKNMTKTICT